MILLNRLILPTKLYILFLLCISAGSVAQHKEISFKHLSTVDGLSNFTVFSIAQDHQGFMWFGTMDGLNRFDGAQIKTFRENPDDLNSLGNNYVYSLQCSSDSGMWVGTPQGLYRYDFRYDNFHATPIVDGSGDAHHNLEVRALLVDENYLWIGTSLGLFKYDLLRKEYELINESGKPVGYINALKKSKDGSLWIGHTQGLTSYKDGKFRNIAIELQQDISLNVISIEIDDAGKVWFGTADLEIGLIIYDPKTQLQIALSKIKGHLPHNRVNCLYRFQDGNIWAGTTWGLAIINEKTFKAQHLMYESQDPGSISQNSIKYIFQSKNGVIWVGTYSGGVNYFDPKSQLITHVTDKYDNENSLNFNIVSSIYEDRNKNLWIGTEYGGVNIYNHKDKTFSVLKEETSDNSLISDNIKSIIEDRKGRKFIATQFGLSIFNSANNSFFNISNKPGSRGFLNNPIVHDLCLDKWGNIWVGATGRNAHFQMYDIVKDTIVHFFPAKRNFPTIDNAIVNSMVYDEKRNTVWAGGENGLAGFNIQTKKYVTDDLFLPAASILQNIIINDVFLDNNGLLWIATFGQGLFIMDVETYQLRKVDRDDGLLESSFYALISDDDGNIWTSVSAHLLKIKAPKGINEPITSIDKFGKQEGFPPQQYFRTTVCKGSDGTLYFGGDDGFISFNPLEVEHIVFHPSVAILDILVNGKSLEIKSKKEDQYLNVASQANVTLTYDQSSFAVEFIGPNFINPENTWYQYQISNVPDIWQDLRNSNVINFSELKAGDYELRLRASSDPGNFEEEFTSINITIEPPYWATPLAYFVYFIVILALLYLFFMVARNWERLSQNLRFEHLEREKEKEFHQRRITFFTDISHELRTPLTLILAPLEKIVSSNKGSAKFKNQLMLMLRNGERMLQLINQLLDLRKLETGHMHLQAAKGDIVHFIQEVSLSFRELASSRNIDFKVESPQKKIIVWFDRDKFEIILFNLLSNAFKFTPEKGKVILSIESVKEGAFENSLGNDFNSEAKGVVKIKIRNTGRGIPGDQIKHIFKRFYTGQGDKAIKKNSSGVGLEIVKKLLDLHKGELSVESSYDENGINGLTIFTINLKCGKKHLSKKDLVKNFKSSEDIGSYVMPELPIPEDIESEEDINDAEKELSILIVEDNDEVRSLLSDIFNSDYQVLQADNGETGLAIAQEKIPDLIISDIMMPEMDGIELCRRIKTEVITSHIPVILLTARTAVTFKYEGLETGADDYITKPFNTEELRLRVGNLIKQRRNLRERFSQCNSFLPSDITLTSPDEKLIKRTVDYIIENIIKEDLTVESIAKEVGLSRANFYRKIKALTNLGAAEYIRMVRIEHAAQLLSTNKLRVSEVGSMVGFSDMDYFRKCFKNCFGVTPKEYIESQSKSPLKD